MSWAEVIARLDELASDNEHFEFYWFPHTDGCLTKRNNRSDGPARPLPRWRHQLDDEFLSNTVFGATCRLGQRYPAVIPAINGIAGKALGARTYTDAAYRVFTSPRRVRFKEQEYAIPREHLAEALTAIRGLFSRHDWRISFPIEVRIAPGDDVWLSTAYGRSTAYIAIHVFHTAPHEEYFREVEAVMTAAGRPPALGETPYPGRGLPARRLSPVRGFRHAAGPTRPSPPVRQSLPGTGAGFLAQPDLGIRPGTGPADTSCRGGMQRTGPGQATLRT